MIKVKSEDYKITDFQMHLQICGEWQKLPKIYSRHLQEQKMNVVLTTSSHPAGEIAGQLISHFALQRGISNCHLY